MAKWVTTLAGLKLLLLMVSDAGSDFICTAEGSFRKPGFCKEYYHCTNVNGYLYSRPDVCPRSYLFDETQSDCVPASTHTNPLGCRKHPTVNKHSSSRKVSTDGSVTTAPPSEEHRLLVSPEDSGAKGYDATDSSAEYATEGSIISGIDESLERKTFEDSEVEGTTESLTVDSPTRAITEKLEGSVDSNLTITIHSMDIRNITNETISAVILELQNSNSNVSDDDSQGIVYLCDQMNNAEAYFELVSGSPLLHDSLAYQTMYNKIVQQYNLYIEKAHNSTYLWRRGRSIPLGLKRSHKKANEYEHNFKAKFSIYKEQIEVKASQETNPDVIQTLDRQIQELTASMIKEQETLDTTKAQAFKKYLEESINSTKREIERLQSLKNPNSEEILLRGLASFLRYVKNDASEVESHITQVLEKIDTLLENIQIDAEDYDKLGNLTNTGFKTLQKEADRINKELKWDAKHQDKLDDEWTGLGDTLYNLRHEESQVRKEIDEREKKLDNFLDKKRILCRTSGLLKYFINETSTKEEMQEACHTVLGHRGIEILDVDAEDARLKVLHGQMKKIQENQSETVKELGSIIPQRTAPSDILPKNQRLVEIEFELYNFRFHDDHLKKLQHGVATARKSILILQQEFQKSQVKFSSLVTKLQNLIDTANAAAVADDAQVGQRTAIENEIEKLQTTLKILVVNNINEC